MIGVIPLAVVLILAGLVMCWGRKQIGGPLLSAVVYHTGVALVIG